MKHRKSIPARPARTATFNVSRFERSGYELEVWDINVGAGAGFVMQRHHYANSKVCLGFEMGFSTIQGDTSR